MNLLNLKNQLSRMEESKNDSMGSLQSLTGLFTDVLKEERRPADVKESSVRINKVLNILGLCHGKGTYGKISEEHIEKILAYCLLKRDYSEFEIECFYP